MSAVLSDDCIDEHHGGLPPLSRYLLIPTVNHVSVVVSLL